LSFLLVFGLLGAAVIGAALFLVCLVMVCHPRHRHRILRSWKFGAVGGGIALVAMALLWMAASDRTETPPSLFVEWFAMAFFAGFAAGLFVMSFRRLPSSYISDVGQTTPEPPSKSA
jgi:drug/metabolite transporter (DMT)-like permease